MVSILPPDVIAKIAAGEVIDRPASVVKELLENALDAGATSIEVHLKDAGKELIHVKDNGHGIAKADLEKLFSRHATSKIKNIDDLQALRSMGFRGEALYSIAAVSDITVRTQKSGSKDAWAIHLRGGSRLGLEPSAPMGAGTDIKVAELFFNTPARRKFLKSNASELNQIAGVVLAYTLIYPDKRFLLTHMGRAILDLKPVAGRLDRTAASLNLEKNDLLQMSQDYPEENVKVQAVLGNINVQRHRRDLQFIFVNDRPVDSKALGFAMNDVYRAVLAPGVYPAFVLDVHVDPGNVDVNIHPAKREVRIKDESRLCSIIRHLTEYTLMRFGSARAIDAPAQPAPSMMAPAAAQTGLPADKIIFGPGQMRQTALKPMPFVFEEAPAAPQRMPDLFETADTTLQTKFGGARFIGAFINKYLLFEEGTSLFLVDQHAAQERIMFEKFRDQIDNGTVEVQPLLTPLLLKLTVQERIHWDEAQEKIKEVGIDTALFDEETLAVHSQPVLLKNIEQSVRALLSGDAIARCDRATIARRACKASIVTGDVLSPAQAEHQRRQLLACQDPFTCPHGRPTVVELKESFLDRQFLRN